MSETVCKYTRIQSCLPCSALVLAQYFEVPYHLWRDRNICRMHVLRVCQPASSNNPPRDQLTFCRSRLVVCDLTMALVSGGQANQISVLATLVHENLSFKSILAAYDFSRAHPTPSHAPERACLRLLVRSCSCPHMNINRSLGVCFLFNYVPSEFDNISITAAPERRGVDLG